MDALLARTEVGTNGLSNQAQKKVECSVRGKLHDTEYCTKFVKLTIEERSKMVFEKNYVMDVTKMSRAPIMQKIVSAEMFVRCVVANIQQHYKNLFSRKGNSEKKLEKQNVLENHKN